MRFLFCFACVLTALAGTNAPENVNSRYTVESVEIDERDHDRLSNSLKRDIDELVGTHFEQGRIDALAQRIRKELRAVAVQSKLVRGSAPEYIRVAFEATRRRLEEDANVTKASYHSRQGWTGGLEGGFHVGANQIAIGVESDGDELIERYAGFRFRVSRPIGEYVRIRFAIQRFHQQWNPATLRDVQPEALYRTRNNFEPTITIAVSPHLSLTAGASFQQTEYQYPNSHFDSAHAALASLRYHRRWDGHDVDASYGLRAATSILASDFAYTRHAVAASYSRQWGNEEVLLRATAGRITGDAPLFERFVLGNTQLLRGWNKFDLAPLGGSRFAHAAFDYRYRVMRVFYDTGSLWDPSSPKVLRHSVGASLLLGKLRDGLAFTVAFPLRAQGVEPVFILSTNF